MPCGFSSLRTKRPLARARAFSSSSAGTASSAIFRNSRTIVSTASSLRAMSTPACEKSEPAALAYLGEQSRRHARAEHGREQLQRPAVRVDERVATGAEAEVRLVGV